MIEDLKLPKNYKIMMHPILAKKIGDEINIIPKKRLIISEWNPIDSITILDMDVIKFNPASLVFLKEPKLPTAIFS